jgi:peptide/nickel transport system permease protein
MKTIQKNLREMLRYPSAIAGLVIIAVLIVVAVYAVVSIPYDKAIELWRGNEADWYQNPKNAQPIWMNFFLKKKLPVSFRLASADGSTETASGSVSKEVSTDGVNTDTTLLYTFDYQYDEFPQEMMLYFNARYLEKKPLVSMHWMTPDGRRIRIDNFTLDPLTTYRFSQDGQLMTRLGDVSPEQGLFADPNTKTLTPLKGTYQLEVEIATFEADSSVGAEFVLQGKVAGLAGTDHMRRDLMVALLWGAPIALAFGLLAALGTTVTTMIISAVGVWFGGWVDELIQRITEVNLVLPFLSILVMVGTFYSKSIWLMLSVTILLSIFTGAIKGYRAMFLQVKDSAYIEAARAYGASSPRIIFQYLIPRLVPLLIPGLVLSIPTFVFLEASLAVLGLGDPSLPTWGKVIYDAQVNAAPYQGLYYWILEPAVLLMITGLAFALLGFALDRIFNPKLREL